MLNRREFVRLLSGAATSLALGGKALAAAAEEPEPEQEPKPLTDTVTYDDLEKCREALEQPPHWPALDPPYCGQLIAQFGAAIAEYEDRRFMGQLES